MTRRQFFPLSSLAPFALSRQPGALVVPVHQILDAQMKWNPAQISRFQSGIWAQAAARLMGCGIRLETSLGAGDVWRPPYREPVVTGLQRGAINVVVTDRIPMIWDGGRCLCGVTTRYRGYHMCMIALAHAHGDQLPFLAVNTCTHELLHALLGDIFEDHPDGLLGWAREYRIDFEATRLWLFHDGGNIRRAAGAYVERLRSQSAR